MSKEQSNEVADAKPLSPLQPLWNGVHKEHFGYRKKTLGKILTIIDAVIPDPKQNKSVKDLITNAVYDETVTETHIALWFNWFDNQYHFEGQDNDAKVPLSYGGAIPAGDFRNYK